jgi:hypothetical protein
MPVKQNEQAAGNGGVDAVSAEYLTPSPAGILHTLDRHFKEQRFISLPA